MEPSPILIVNVVALVLGPIAAVLVARVWDDRRQRRDRRYSAFTELMCIRGNPASPKHVEVLNLIEIEFADAPEVIRARRSYFAHLKCLNAHPAEEKIAPGISSNRLKQNQYLSGLEVEASSLLASLIYAIANEIRFDIGKIEVFEDALYSGRRNNGESLREKHLKETSFGRSAKVKLDLNGFSSLNSENTDVSWSEDKIHYDIQQNNLFDSAIKSLEAAMSAANRMKPEQLKLAVSVANNAIRGAGVLGEDFNSIEEQISLLRGKAELHQKSEIGLGYLLAEQYLTVAQFRLSSKYAGRAQNACRDFGKFVHLVLGHERSPRK